MHAEQNRRPNLTRVRVLISSAVVLLAGCVDHTISIAANSDPTRIVPIRRLVIVARLNPAGAYKPDIQDRVLPMLRSCGIDAAVDIRNIAPILSSSLVEPPPGVQADAVLVLDKINDPINPYRQPSYALRLRRIDGQTIWRATAEQDPALRAFWTKPDAVFATALINRMVADKVLPGNCWQASA